MSESSISRFSVRGATCLAAAAVVLQASVRRQLTCRPHRLLRAAADQFLFVVERAISYSCLRLTRKAILYAVLSLACTVVMENDMALVDHDEETSRPSSVASNESFDLEIVDFPDDHWTERNEDDGYDSLAETSDPEEIYLDKRYPRPQPPPPPAVPFVQIDGEAEPVINYNRRPRRMEDRYHPHSRKLSRGYDNQGPKYTLR